jgi:dienelactone hydrolase
MRNIGKSLGPLAVLGALSLAVAQTPAPVLSTEKDTDGKSLPFGRAPYLSPETPLGSGPYKAIMVTDDTLPAHVLYYPKDMAKAGKLPIVAWGNGACVNAGNRFRYFLTEISSYGFLVIASGIMAPTTMEVGPQENPPVRAPGAPAPAKKAAGTGPPKGNPPTTAAQLTEAIDWATKENSRKGSKFYNRLDTTKVGVAGQSCGGGQAFQVAGDPRLTTVAFFSSGGGGAQGGSESPYARIHTPVLYLTGDVEHDIAYQSGISGYQGIDKYPVFSAWKEKLTHIGTYGLPDGGELGKLADAWFSWQLRGDKKAAKIFQGADCALCKDPTWHVAKKNID